MIFNVPIPPHSVWNPAVISVLSMFSNGVSFTSHVLASSDSLREGSTQEGNIVTWCCHKFTREYIHYKNKQTCTELNA